MSTPTTRRHPRTLAEAFPRDHACAVEHYRPMFGGRLSIVIRAAVILVCCFLIGWMAAQGLN